MMAVHFCTAIFRSLNRLEVGFLVFTFGKLYGSVPLNCIYYVHPISKLVSSKHNSCVGECSSRAA